MAYFEKEAVLLYICKQVAEGIPVINASPSGTISTTVGSANVTGSGTSFTTQVPEGAYLYTSGNAIIGRVKTVSSNTAIVLESVVPASATTQAQGVMAIATAVTGAAFKVNLGPKNCVPVIAPAPNTVVNTESYKYSGSASSRDETTIRTDIYTELKFENFLPWRGTIAGGDPVISEIPLAHLYQGAGLSIVLSSGSAGYWEATNEIATDAFLTIVIRKNAAALGLEEKEYVITDCRGTFDLDASVGTIPKLTFNFNGNRNNPTDNFQFVPDYQNQLFDVSTSLLQQSINLSELVKYTSAAEPTLTGTTNTCMNKVLAPNFPGYEFNRVQLACLAGWSRKSVASDVTITILEEEADATFNPDANLGNDFKYALRYSNGGTLTAGKRNEILMKKLNLTKTTDAEVAGYSALDLNMRNTGVTKIKFY